jgi:hypothetical protein
VTAIPPTGTQSSFLLEYGSRLAGFGVGLVAVLAPFLGKSKVPGFSALIEVYPTSLQDSLIPFSGIFMAAIAIAVESKGLKQTTDLVFERWMPRILSIFGLSFVLLLVIYYFSVVRIGHSVARASGEPPDVTTIAVITGSRTVPQQVPGSDCTCRAGQPAVRCVEEISLSPSNIDSCFGSNWIAFVTVVLVVLYLAVIGSFAAAVGLLILRQRRTQESSESA